MPTSRLRIISLDEVVSEASRTKTFRYSDNSKARPGQFAMVWIPGVEEFPVSLSQVGPIKAFILRDAGQNVPKRLQQGDKIGIRGPLGNGFDLSRDRYLVAAGGTGVVSIVAAAEAIAAAGKKVATVLGARTKEELILQDRVRRCGEALIATDDGSMGYHGSVSDLALKLMEERTFEGVLASGPEKMLRNLTEGCQEHDVEIQVSLERFMRCGMGLCGSCSLGSYLVCADGPVFTGEQLADVRDFGSYRRDRAGRRVPL